MNINITRTLPEALKKRGVFRGLLGVLAAAALLGACEQITRMYYPDIQDGATGSNGQTGEPGEPGAQGTPGTSEYGVVVNSWNQVPIAFTQKIDEATEVAVVTIVGPINAAAGAAVTIGAGKTLYVVGEVDIAAGGLTVNDGGGVVVLNGGVLEADASHTLMVNAGGKVYVRTGGALALPRLYDSGTAATGVSAGKIGRMSKHNSGGEIVFNFEETKGEEVIEHKGRLIITGTSGTTGNAAYGRGDIGVGAINTDESNGNLAFKAVDYVTAPNVTNMVVSGTIGAGKGLTILNSSTLTADLTVAGELVTRNTLTVGAARSLTIKDGAEVRLENPSYSGGRLEKATGAGIIKLEGTGHIVSAHVEVKVGRDDDGTPFAEGTLSVSADTLVISFESINKTGTGSTAVNDCTVKLNQVAVTETTTEGGKVTLSGKGDTGTIDFSGYGQFTGGAVASTGATSVTLGAAAKAEFDIGGLLAFALNAAASIGGTNGSTIILNPGCLVVHTTGTDPAEAISPNTLVADEGDLFTASGSYGTALDADRAYALVTEQSMGTYVYASGTWVRQ
jgi:hypothetical protein